MDKNRDMKVCIVQPFYSTDYNDSDDLFKWEMDALDKCDDSMDIIVFPDACDVPALTKNKEQAAASRARYTDALIRKARITAKRCNSVVFINAGYDAGNGVRNTTYAIDRDGNIAGLYFKQHPTNGEVFNRKLDCDYSYEYEEPTIVKIDGLRYAFLTCYDFYFYEAYAHIARKRPDFIIGCSHQRSDTHSALEIMSRFLAYNTNAFVLRSSVSMDENSNIGGASMVVAPNGDVLLNMKSTIGMECITINPSHKYYKPAGYGNPPSAHFEYIEKGRRPWKYRPGGSGIILPNNLLDYPRLCAHRGFNTVAPENSMPAYGSAVASGAMEIEFDIWETKDGEIVSCHDINLDRVSNGTGKIPDMTLEELKAFDFGKGFNGAYTGLKILTFEQILKHFACRTIMNIHVKTYGNGSPLDEGYLKKIIDLIYKYDCQNYVYFMTGNDHVIPQLKRLAPEIEVCVGGGDDPWGIVDRAIKFGCTKVQLFKPYFNQEMIDKAHENGIRCNVFWSDEPNEANKFIDMGIDCILTNDYQRIATALGDKIKGNKLNKEANLK